MLSRQTRSRLAILGVGALLGTLAYAWLGYFPPSPMIVHAGLPGEAADDGDRRCERAFPSRTQGRIATLRVNCRSVSHGHGELRDDHHISMDFWSRRTRHAQRLWQVPDSLAWTRAQDSVVQALEFLGGKTAWCAWNALPESGPIKARRSWRFPGYDVRLVAYRHMQGTQPVWVLQVDAFRGGAPECGGPPLVPA